MKYTLKIRDLTFKELFELARDEGKKCFVVFNEDGLKRRYPLPRFDDIRGYAKWVYSGRLAYKSDTMDSSIYYIHVASEIDVYPR